MLGGPKEEKATNRFKHMCTFRERPGCEVRRGEGRGARGVYGQGGSVGPEDVGQPARGRAQCRGQARWWVQRASMQAPTQTATAILCIANATLRGGRRGELRLCMVNAPYQNSSVVPKQRCECQLTTTTFGEQPRLR